MRPPVLARPPPPLVATTAAVDIGRPRLAGGVRRLLCGFEDTDLRAIIHGRRVTRHAQLLARRLRGEEALARAGGSI